MAEELDENLQDEVTAEDISKALSELKEENYFTEEEIQEIEELTKASKEDTGMRGKTNAKVEENEEEEEEEEESDDDSSDDDSDDDSYFSPGSKKGSYRKVKKAKDGKEEFVDENEYEKKKLDKGGYTFVAKEKEMKKGEDLLDLIKGEEFSDEVNDSPILKGLLTEIAEQNISTNKKVESYKKSTGNMATLIKGLVQSTNEKIEDLQDEISAMKRTPGIRKSASANALSRFSGNDLAKGGDNKETMSVSHNKAKILNTLEELTFSKGGFDDEMSKALMTFETGAPLSDNVRRRVEEQLKVNLVD